MPDAFFLHAVENLQGMCERLPGASKGLLPLPSPLPFDPVLSTLFDDFDDRDVDDRDDARSWCNQDISIDKGLLPNLIQGDYYWHQLVGLSVVSEFEGQQFRLGVVKSLLETGANDVLVIKGDTESIDREERLIPYVEQFVTQVDMTAKKIDVIWDPEF